MDFSACKHPYFRDGKNAYCVIKDIVHHGFRDVSSLKPC